MTKSTILLLLILLTISCSDKNQKENTITQIEKLRTENDSLKNIISEIKDKYVFDSISFRDIPSSKNTYQMNTNATGEIVLVGYSGNNKTNIIMVDSITYNPEILHNPDTLKMKKGGFQYSKRIDEERIYIQMLIETNNSYGKKHGGILTTAIKARKN